MGTELELESGIQSSQSDTVTQTGGERGLHSGRDRLVFARLDVRLDAVTL